MPQVKALLITNVNPKVTHLDPSIYEAQKNPGRSDICAKHRAAKVIVYPLDLWLLWLLC